MIITGPNGCGKSSLFRIISGLWPTYGGIVIRPGQSFTLKTGRPALFYIPQKPYMTVGCLRDQITYPTECKPDECCDEEFLNLLELVDLKGIVDREPDGLNAVGDWDSTLSGGEKQRLAMTRLFYHAPQYALLDECSSAVSLEAEGAMYETAQRKGITLLTITHRVSSLAKYHRLILRFDGDGGWSFGPLHKENELVQKSAPRQNHISINEIKVRVEILKQLNVSKRLKNESENLKRNVSQRFNSSKWREI